MAKQGRNEEARREMLASIRAHLAASAPHDAVRAAHHAAAAHGEDVSAREEKAAPARQFEGTPVERFRQALEAVAGHCFVVKGEAAASDRLRRIILERGARRIALTDGILANRVGGLGAIVADANTGGEVEYFQEASAAQLFECDLGITGADYAVAETGTLVLSSKYERHRLASLVPATHVAVIEAARVRDTLAEVLEEVNGQGLSPAITFITGPSRTSDIELQLAIGVHGPGELYVIIVEPSG